MKDEQARRDIAYLQNDITRLQRNHWDSNRALWDAVLRRRIAAPDDVNAPVEKDCPVCKRVTLMRKDGAQVKYDAEKSFGSTIGYYTTVRPQSFYCYSCGKTFKEVETKALVEAER
jgi:transposase-like protein